MRLIDADALKENLKNLILPNIPEEGEEGNFDNFLSNIILKQAIEDIDDAPTVNIDWTKHETATGSSKSVSVNPAYPLGGSGNYQCSNTVDVVPVKSIEQLMWERDTAIQQLEEHGIPFCGKADVVAVVRCKDCKHLDICKRGTLYCLKTELIISSLDWYCADGEREDDEQID